MSQIAELNELRSMLVRGLAMVDAIIEHAPDRGSHDDVSRFRDRPGGRLNDAGIAEVHRRLDAGESDSRIALEMGISPVNVGRRRMARQKPNLQVRSNEPLRFRVRPGGPLSDDGIAEVIRRFEAGESDGRIAREMDISVVGVARRRRSWRNSRD